MTSGERRRRLEELRMSEERLATLKCKTCGIGPYLSRRIAMLKRQLETKETKEPNEQDPNH